MVQELLNFKVTDLMGVAGATIGVVIANAILLSALSAKYGSIAERYRTLCTEYRGGEYSEPRGTSLRNQIHVYETRMACMRQSGNILSSALLVFLVAIACASLGVIFPTSVFIKVLSALGLFIGLFLMAWAAALELIENNLSKHIIPNERVDLSGLSR